MIQLPRDPEAGRTTLYYALSPRVPSPEIAADGISPPLIVDYGTVIEIGRALERLSAEEIELAPVAAGHILSVTLPDTQAVGLKMAIQPFDYASWFSRFLIACGC